MMHINILSDTNRRIPRKRIKELIALIDEEEEPPESIVNIIFGGDKQILALNRKFRGVSKPTDVLSFNIDDNPGEDAIFGEVYISTDTAARNVRSGGPGFFDELIRLCCHGYLHLLGYDHEKEKDRKVMQSKESYYLERIG